MMADINQYLAAQGSPPAGFIDPTLYYLATTSQTFPPFRDVASGSNGTYNTRVGWDETTGWGSVDAWSLAASFGLFKINPLMAAASPQQAQVDMVYRSADNSTDAACPVNALCHISFSAGTWTGPTSLGGVLNSQPSVVSRGATRLDVFALGTNNALYHISSSNSGQTWSGWEALGGDLKTPPVAVSSGSGTLDVFALGSNSTLYHIAYNPSLYGGNGWSAWQPLGGTAASAPTAVSAAPETLDVFYRDATTNALDHVWYDGTRWNGPLSLGEWIVASPSAVSVAQCRVDVFALGSDSGLYQYSYNNPNLTPNGWSLQALGGWLGSAPTAVPVGNGKVDVFAMASNDALYLTSSTDDTHWSTWQPLGGWYTSGPTAVNGGPGTVEAFGRGTNGVPYATTGDGTTFGSPIPLGGVVGS